MKSYKQMKFIVKQKACVLLTVTQVDKDGEDNHNNDNNNNYNNDYNDDTDDNGHNDEDDDDTNDNKIMVLVRMIVIMMKRVILETW